VKKSLNSSLNRSLTWELVLKDWRLHRPMVLSCMVAGAGALAFSQWGNEPALVVGSVVFFIAIIMAGTMLPILGIVNERKNHNLAFLMSLPITILEYTTAKLISTLAIFLVPWLTLVILAISVVEFRAFLPHGVIPVTLILCSLPFVGMCIMIAAALVGESEGWGIAANIFCQSSYGLAWYFLIRTPAIGSNVGKASPVWNATTVNILGGEFVAILAILGLTYFLQSRKRDFV
jgi:ABC-2 type transport system permease protein